MATLNSYLTFPGNSEEVFNFYKSVFGGEFSVVQHFKDTPFGQQMSDDDKEKIMHIALPIGKTSVLMASDALESMGQSIVIGNHSSISIHADSEEEADKLFSGISEGGKITMPMEKAFWGDYFGMCNDKYGIQWLVSYSYPKA